MKKYQLCFLVLTLIASSGLVAQQAEVEFGQNRLQFKTFDWKFYETENFNLYYYDDGNEIARNAIDYLEEEFNRISDILGYLPPYKTEIYLYNSITDLQQSNIGITENEYNEGGQTNFNQNFVEVAYQGTQTEFQKELSFHVANTLINDMLFGGSLGDMVQNTFLLSLPEWFSVGAARYIAFGWDEEMDDYVRAYFNSDSQKEFHQLSKNEAIILGQSVWNYMVQEYGRIYMSNVLNLTRINRNEQSSIAYTLGIPFKQFLKGWEDYYKRINEPVMNAYVDLPDNPMGKIKNTKEGVFTDLSVSPDGKRLVYVKNINGRHKVYYRNLETEKETIINRGGQYIINQRLDEELPKLAWMDSVTVGILSSKRGISTLEVINVETKKGFSRSTDRFLRINDFSFSPSGNHIVMSASVNGQTDLFLFNLRRNTVRRINNDPYDDLNPRFVEGRRSLVFSSNRPLDSLSDIKDLKTFNIYIWPTDSAFSDSYSPIKTISNDTKPVVRGDEMVYLSDQKGVTNVFYYNLSTGLGRQLTNFSHSLDDIDFSFESNTLVYTVGDMEGEYIYSERNFDLNRNVFTPQTPRQQRILATIVANRINARQEQPQVVEQNQTPLDTIVINSDTIPEEIADVMVDDQNKNIINTDDYQFDIEQNDNDEFLDTENYAFEKSNNDATQNKQPDIQSKSTFLSNYRKYRRKSEVEGPYEYQPRFHTNFVTTTIGVNPLLGFGLKLQGNMSDILQNHIMSGGVFLSFRDLKSGGIFTEYQFLKYLIDFKIKFERETFFVDPETESSQINDDRHKYVKNKITLGAAYPFSVRSRLEFNPFYLNTQFHSLSPVYTQFPDPDQSRQITNYGGFDLAYVFDDTEVVGRNAIIGTRAKAVFTSMNAFGDKSKSFNKLIVDVRHYEEIFRTMTFAVRGFYGQYFNNKRQTFLLGGMDNWLFFDNADRPNQEHPLNFKSFQQNDDIYFVDYITTLRGFDYNTFNGSKVALLNAELRVPIARVLYRGFIGSNFIRNFSFIGFYDIGTAWTTISPFDDESEQNVDIITTGPNGPFVAKVQNFSNKWLYSWGFGARTVFLGYYMKFDVAWPTINYNVQDPKFYFTLGYDF
ncbi:PD40 domain-containing protein [Marinigracilibium pacificum]|uniref:WD40 repeat protein n=1 Tax=Marinigracilibium pacificum TaxID=2729599 RepID=A0A848J2A0_9BACT|nr:PD40 domain-containing protein [Marinigracilibium pacificum]NMM48670.1 hypothetical protein [Marinigracilibium pacificum]